MILDVKGHSLAEAGRRAMASQRDSRRSLGPRLAFPSRRREERRETATFAETKGSGAAAHEGRAEGHSRKGPGAALSDPEL